MISKPGAFLDSLYILVISPTGYYVMGTEVIKISNYLRPFFKCNMDLGPPIEDRNGEFTLSERNESKGIPFRGTRFQSSEVFRRITETTS